MHYIYIRGFTKFGIKVLWRLQFLEYLKLRQPTGQTQDNFNFGPSLIGANAQLEHIALFRPCFGLS